MKGIKKKLYFLKVWYKDIFLYPKETIEVSDSQDYDRYWKEKRGREIGVLSDWQKIRADIVLSFLPRDTKISIADIGCGEGSILTYIKERTPTKEVIGYDSSDFVLQKAQAIGVTAHPIDFNDDKNLQTLKRTDYTLLLEVLEHTPHSEKILRAAYESSTKGVLFSFPNSGYFIFRLRLLFGKFPKQWVTFPNEHLRFWTLADVAWWLKALGYKHYHIRTYKGIPLLNKLLPGLFAAGIVVYVHTA